jgi:hypothetical protein
MPSDRKVADRGQSCCYCGIRAATERDHVPPKSLFLDPFPSDMVTVPACSDCNRRFGVLDEETRVHLSLVMQVCTPETMAFWKRKALPTVARKRRMREEILASMRRVQISTAGGLHLGDATVSPWDQQRRNAFVERLVRGLYFHHFGEGLGFSAQFFFCRGGVYDDGFQTIFDAVGHLCDPRSIGGDQFVYRFGGAEDCPVATVWFFAFHRRYFLAAVTQPAVGRSESVAPCCSWPGPQAKDGELSPRAED